MSCDDTYTHLWKTIEGKGFSSQGNWFSGEKRKETFFLETSLAGLEGLVGDGNVHQSMRICVIRMNLEGKENQELCHILCPRKVRVDKV